MSYSMQEKQASSLQGKQSNLADIMLKWPITSRSATTRENLIWDLPQEVSRIPVAL